MDLISNRTDPKNPKSSAEFGSIRLEKKTEKDAMAAAM